MRLPVPGALKCEEVVVLVRLSSEAGSEARTVVTAVGSSLARRRGVAFGVFDPTALGDPFPVPVCLLGRLIARTGC